MVYGKGRRDGVMVFPVGKSYRRYDIDRALDTGTVGTDADGAVTESKQVIFGETYGTLPEPVKEGSIFAGWEYSGQTITADTVVQMTGEHVLTAIWK